MNHTIRMKPSNRLVCPFALQPDDVILEDIAHHLSRANRFAGGTDGDDPYVVAQHGVLVSEEVERRAIAEIGLGILTAQEAAYLCLWALHHDDEEAYGFGDIPSPMKRHPAYAEVRAAAKRANAVIVVRFGLRPEEPPMVKRVDAQLADTESRDLRGVVEGTPLLHVRVIPWAPGAARRRFIERHHEIIKQCGRP